MDPESIYNFLEEAIGYQIIVGTSGSDSVTQGSLQHFSSAGDFVYLILTGAVDETLLDMRILIRISSIDVLGRLSPKEDDGVREE